MKENPLGLEICRLPILRVSAAAFADIRYNDGQRALTVNKNRLLKGEKVLTPIGGAIELTAGGINELKQLLEIEDIAFEKGRDLRLIIAGKNANKLREWFLRRENRETTPKRELKEELVDELDLLTPADLAGIQFELLGFQTELAETNRVGQEGKMTLRLVEVHEAQLPDVVLAKLLQKAAEPEAMIRFVDDQEIIASVTKEGTEIGSVANLLLKPAESIPVFR